MVAGINRSSNAASDANSDITRQTPDSSSDKFRASEETEATTEETETPHEVYAENYEFFMEVDNSGPEGSPETGDGQVQLSEFTAFAATEGLDEETAAGLFNSADFNVDEALSFEEFDSLFRPDQIIEIPGSDKTIVVSQTRLDTDTFTFGGVDANGNGPDVFTETVGIIEDLIEHSPTFRQQIDGILEQSGGTSLAVFPFEENIDEEGLLTTGFVPVDESGEPIGDFMFINEEIGSLVPDDLQGTEKGDQIEQQLRASTIVHELLHHNGNIPGHGPEHSQQVATIMNEYLSGTEQEALYDIEAVDYSVDSLGDQQEILDTVLPDGRTIGEVRDNIHSYLKAGNYNRAIKEFEALEGINIEQPYIDPDHGDKQVFSTTADQWMADYFMYETFDTNIGGSDEDTPVHVGNGSELNSGVGLEKDLQRFYDFLERTGNDDGKIIALLDGSAQTFGSSFA